MDDLGGGSNPVKHVIIAVALAGVLFIIAGDSWSRNIGKLQPVRAVQPGEK